MITAPRRLPAKTEVEAKLYAIDFTQALGSAQISTATWTSIPETLTFDNDSLLNTNTKAQARISGGTVGVDYIVSCKVVTNESPTQTYEARPMLKVIQGVDVA